MDLLGMVPSLIGGFLGNEYANERQEDQQHFNIGAAHDQRVFNSAEAIAQRDWQEKMSATAWQRGVTDMQAAGINPMLAVSKGGAHVGTGAHATSGAASSGIAGGHGFDIAGAMHSASQIDLNESQKRLAEKQADRTAAEEAEIRARTPRHEADIEQVNQQVAESKKRVEHLIEQIKLTTAQANTTAQTAIHLDAQTRQANETIKQIHETVKLLREQTVTTKAHGKAHLAAADRDSAQEREISQRITHNLPALTAALHELEAKARALEMPRRGMDAAAHSSFLGALSAVLRALNPFANLTGAIR